MVWLLDIRTLLRVEEIGDVRAIIAGLHDNVSSSEVCIEVVNQHGELLLFGLWLVIGMPGIVNKDVCKVLADMHCVPRVRNGVEGELIGGLLWVPLSAEEWELDVLNG